MSSIKKFFARALQLAAAALVMYAGLLIYFAMKKFLA
jgi:hypothetical protein